MIYQILVPGSIFPSIKSKDILKVLAPENYARAPAADPKQEYDKIAEALDQWARAHSHPGEPVLIVGENSYTPKALADEVRNRTILGEKLSLHIVELAVRKQVEIPFMFAKSGSG